jgi:predicted dehydrogenase
VQRRALLIGCGNIGAGYDFDRPDQVLTHARAYSRLGIAFDVVDPDGDRAARVAGRYGARSYAAIEELDPTHYEIVSVASATPTHAGYLEVFLAAGTPLVICEKPVAARPAEIDAVLARYASGRSAVVVNYLRRFQPAYQRLRNRLRQWTASDPLRRAVVRYQRGFLNNGGHALDTLEYLFDQPVDLASLRSTATLADAFPDDPTITGSFRFQDATVELVGVPPPAAGVFDIVLELGSRRIELLERGDRIVDGESSEAGCVESYMLPVFQTALHCLESGDRRASNFEAACRLNREILRATERLTAGGGP